MLQESSCTDIVLKAILKGKYEMKQLYSKKIARGPLSVEITLKDSDGDPSGCGHAICRFMDTPFID